MVCFRQRAARWGGLTAAAVVTVGALLVGGLPSGGQETDPVPATAPVCRITHVGEMPRRGTTGVTVEFLVPAGTAVSRTPCLRVVDERGRLVALTPMFVQSWGPPVSRAYREIPTGTYRAGNHQMTAEFEHRDAKGQIGRAVSAAAQVVGRGRPLPP